MQSTTLKPKSAAHVGIAPVNYYGKQDAESATVTDNEEGFIIVKKGEGVYYVRYDIIFAKAGDVFFMPRKVPQGFNLESDRVNIFCRKVFRRGNIVEFQAIYFIWAYCHNLFWCL